MEAGAPAAPEPLLPHQLIDSDPFSRRGPLTSARLLHVRSRPARVLMIDRAFFPYGRAAFQTIRREKQFFVDNTAYIKEFEKNPLQCFTRPPRWGKSLLIQILMCYYDKATTPDQWDLFSQLAIHKNPTKLRGHFQVLKLDFSEAATGSVEDMNEAMS